MVLKTMDFEKKGSSDRSKKISVTFAREIATFQVSFRNFSKNLLQLLGVIGYTVILLYYSIAHHCAKTSC